MNAHIHVYMCTHTRDTHTYTHKRTYTIYYINYTDMLIYNFTLASARLN